MRRTITTGLLCALLPLAVAAQPEPSDADGPLATAEVAFTYGLAAYQEGDLDEAERLLAEAVAHQPEHGGAWYWLGLVHLRQGEGEAAERAFERALSARREPPVERARVRDDLARARRLGTGEEAVVAAPVYAGEVVTLQALPRWEGRLGLSYGDDSNPALLPEDLPAFLPDGDFVQGEESDSVIAADLRLEIHPFYGRGGWTLGAGLAGRQALFDDAGSLDFRHTRGFAHLAWGGDPAGYLVGPLGYTRVPVGNRRVALLFQAAVTEDELDGETFGESVEAAAAVTFRETGHAATQLDLVFRDEEFADDARVVLDPLGFFPGDREETSLRLSQWLYFASRNGYLRLSALAGERDAGGDFDSDLTELAAEVALPLSPRLFVFLSGALGEEDYDGLGSNPLFGTFFGDEPRQDETTRLSAAVTFAATPRLWVTLRGTSIDRDVALGAADQVLDLDTDRTVASIGLRWFFDGGRVER